jgi:oligoribonuclease (3'-5' exoribonuclease)
MPKVVKNPHPAKGNSLPAVTPVQVDRVRRSVLDVVRKNIPEVREVLAGTKKWDAQQTRLFSIMLNKVMPDLHHSFNEHTIENKSVEELSIEELQRIAAQDSKQPLDGEIIEEVYDDTDSPEGGSEAPTVSQSEG